jgi:hypothetical protein
VYQDEIGYDLVWINIKKENIIGDYSFKVAANSNKEFLLCDHLTADDCNKRKTNGNPISEIDFSLNH